MTYVLNPDTSLATEGVLSVFRQATFASRRKPEHPVIPQQLAFAAH